MDQSKSLQTAISMGSIDLVKNIIDQGNIHFSDDEKLNKSLCSFWGGNTPLHQAVKVDNLQIAKLLLERGINVNARNLSGHTAFHYAVFDGQAEMTKLLLEHGACVDLPVNGLTPLMLAIQNKSDAHLRTIRQFINKCDVNRTDLSLENALHKAIWFECTDFVLELLAAGIDINAQNMSGTTPLMRAASLGSSKTVDILLAKGADVNLQNNEGKNALHYASMTVLGNGIVNRLIESGIDVNCQDKYGQTALHLAAHHCLVMVARSLLLDNCNVSVPDNNFETPLDVSISRHSHQITHMLLLSGCEISPNQIDLIYSYDDKITNVQLQKCLLRLMMYLDSVTTYPSTLLELSRKSLRKSIGNRISEKLEHLALPSRLKYFILLEELKEI